MTTFNFLSAVVVAMLTSLGGASATDVCPEFLPLRNETIQSQINTRVGRLPSALSPEFMLSIQQEIRAAYASAKKEDFDALHYTMFATVCRQIQADSELSGAQRARLMVDLGKEMLGSAPLADPATPNTDPDTVAALDNIAAERKAVEKCIETQREKIRMLAPISPDRPDPDIQRLVEEAIRAGAECQARYVAVVEAAARWNSKD